MVAQPAVVIHGRDIDAGATVEHIEGAVISHFFLAEYDAPLCVRASQDL